VSLTTTDNQGSMLDRWIPGLRMVRHYDRSWLRSDLVAGLVLAAILVPQGMAYAELAGLPAVTGLYTTIACLVAYALFGPSRILVLGPDSSVSPMILAAITPLIAFGDTAKAIELAGMLALFVGFIEIALGVGRLGFVADLLAREVQVGYLNGLAFVIIVGQLPKLCGFSTDAEGFVHELSAWARHLGDTNGKALAVGLGVLAVLLVLPRFSKKLPAVLVAVVGATVVSAIANLADKGVKVVGTLPRGFPTPTVPFTTVHDVGPLAVAAIGITMVSLADTIALASSFAARRNEEVKADQEMVAMGTANIAAGLVSGFAISSSASRTAVAEQSGAKSQMTGVVGAAIVLVLLLFLNGVLKDLPQSALAGVVIAAALSLIDIPAVVGFAKARPSAFVLSIITSLGVIFLGVLPGIVIAILLAVLLFFHRNWWPHGAVLGRVAGHGWHNIEDRPDAVQLPGVLVFRWEAPLFFANAGLFRRQVRAQVRERNCYAVVLQCEAISDVDVTAAAVLDRLQNDFEGAHVEFVYAELRQRLHEQLEKYGLKGDEDRDRFYSTLEGAVAHVTAGH
jgi:high affinity sulfate transporter 1